MDEQSSINHTHSTLIKLTDEIGSNKVNERRRAAQGILEQLQDPNTVRKLQWEATRAFANIIQRDARAQTIFPEDRVNKLFRTIIVAAVCSSQKLTLGTSDNTRKRTKKSANATGFCKNKPKFNADDILFPYKVFVKMDVGLEVNDGGYGGLAGGITWDKDWKTKNWYGHHLDLSCLSSGGSGGSAANGVNLAVSNFSATHYTPHEPTARSRLGPKYVLECVKYCIECLNDETCVQMADTAFMQWLLYICARPEYLAMLPFHHEMSQVLHEVTQRLNKAFDWGGKYDKGILPPRHSSTSGSYNHGVLSQETLLASAKCLSAVVYNCTVKLGNGMQLYMRSIIELVSVWAEHSWRLQSEGSFASASSSEPQYRTAKVKTDETQQHLGDFRAKASRDRRQIRTEADILALMPYMYSAVTHLLAAHPEQAVSLLSENGHSLMRLARRNYARTTINLQTRDALTEYIGAHLLVAETSGRLVGLPEGDLGPLESRRREYEGDDNNLNRKKGPDEFDFVSSQSQKEDSEMDVDGSKHSSKHSRKNKKRGATLDTQSINSLLEIVRNEKVWESLFSASATDQNVKKKKTRKSLSGRNHGRSNGITFENGGATWAPLNRRQRRYLELLARLTRISQRLYVAEAEDKGNDTIDTVESLIDSGTRGIDHRSGIEHGDIEILQDGESKGASHNVTSADLDERHVASPERLACSPWIRNVCRHLYKLNPKLDVLAEGSTPRDGDVSQLDGTIMGDRSNQEDTSSHRVLLESCPMLQALVAEMDESRMVDATQMTQAHFTQQTLNSTFIAPSASSGLDTKRPKTTATLQLLCSCAESFPRGECWTSSARRNWSTVLDESLYPAGASPRVLERHGSSPSDAAAVVYLLGTTLEVHGGSAGEEDVQLWSLVALLKMTESCAIICSREGLSNRASFGSPSALGALRVAWQYVWTTLFRIDLRYSSYTSGAYGSNVGELILQLLTQIVRYQCTDRRSLLSCNMSSIGLSAGVSRSSMDDQAGSDSFVYAEQGRLWKLPVFDDVTSLFSAAPFELITSVVLCADLVDAPAVAALSESRRDRQWFVSFCMRFIEQSLKDSPESIILRSFLAHASICISTLISDGGIAPDSWTCDMDMLTRFAVTEDTEPITFSFDPDGLHIQGDGCTNSFFNALWSNTLMPNRRVGDVDQGLTHRIVQGRAAFLSKFCDANYERNLLRKYTSNYTPSSGAARATQRSKAASDAFDTARAIFDDVLQQMRNISHDTNVNSDDEEEDTRNTPEKTAEAKRKLIPRLTASLVILTGVVMARNQDAMAVSVEIAHMYAETYSPAFDFVRENARLFNGNAPELLAVLGHVEGIVRVLTLIAATGGGGMDIPNLFGGHAKSLYRMCRVILKDFRNDRFTANSSTGVTPSRGGRVSSTAFDSSDEESFTQTQNTQSMKKPKKLVPSSRFSDDSDDLMGDDVDDDFRRSANIRAPPTKRRRMGGSKSARGSKPSRDYQTAFVDDKCAWASASLMVLLQPSFKCVEFISGHLVWPEDNNNNSGYQPVSKQADPTGILMCARIVAQKSVILRRDRLDLRHTGDEDNENAESALILCLEMVLEARRQFSPASPHFMCGFGLLARLVDIANYGESCGSIGEDESKVIVEVLHPESLGAESDDHHLLKKQKRIFRHRSSYRTQQLLEASQIVLRANSHLVNKILAFFGSRFVVDSLKTVDEDVRSLARDAIGVSLLRYSDQNIIVSEISKAIPIKLSNEKKLHKWTENSLQDQKLSDDLFLLEQAMLKDVEASVVYHTIECLGLIAGSTSDSLVSRDMIGRLIDIAFICPNRLLACHRACARASLLLGFKNVASMFESMMPFLVVRWLESQRNIKDFPLLIMSPVTLDRACRYLPNEVLTMLLQGNGWSDEYFSLDGAGVSKTLNESLLPSFVASIAKFLVPNILLAAPPENDGNSNDHTSIIDSRSYLRECVQIIESRGHGDSPMNEGPTDGQIAEVLDDHINNLYGYIGVLYATGNANDELNNAINMLQRSLATLRIQKTAAKGAFVALRHMLLLRQTGIHVVGICNIEATSETYLTGMKHLSTLIKSSPSSRKNANFLEMMGSCMTECVVLVKYWLSSSVSARQRQETYDTFSLLVSILQDGIANNSVTSSDVGFCLHSFMVIFLDPENSEILPSVFESLGKTLKAMFADPSGAIVSGSMAVLHKLTFALLQIHQRACHRLFSVCNAALSTVQYEQKASQGLLSAVEDAGVSWDCLGAGPWMSTSQQDGVLRTLISGKVEIEERISSDTMVGAYDCLQTIVSSGKIHFDDLIGADDIINQTDRRNEVFKSVNQKFSLSQLFNSISSENSRESSFAEDCENFILTLQENPISHDQLDTKRTSSLSHSVLARSLALRRLEKALMNRRKASVDEEVDHKIYPFLLAMAHSSDPEESLLISSRCLGMLSLNYSSLQDTSLSTCGDSREELSKSLDDPLLSVKRTILTLVGKFLLSECSDTSLIAMKTAKSLLVSSSVKEILMTLEEETRGLLGPFGTADEKVKKETLKMSDFCSKHLKAMSGSSDQNSWCWSVKLWSCYEDDSCDVWIRSTVCSIISCCFDKGTSQEHQVSSSTQEFFRVCVGLSAVEPTFAAAIFPGLIFSLLDGDVDEENAVQSSIAIGSQNSRMHKVISRCFSGIISTKTGRSMSSQAVGIILNTLELLRSITEHRFRTSSEHTKNQVGSSRPNSSKSMSKRSRSRTNDTSSSTTSKRTNYKSLPDSPKWRGFPYGVVVKVDGLDVARACFKIKRYHSALYYAEMCMQNLVGTGKFFVDASRDTVLLEPRVVHDISGFGLLAESRGADDILDRALVAQDIIGYCLDELRAKDELEGVLLHGATLKLKRNITSLNDLAGRRHDSAFSMLTDLDSGLQLATKKDSASIDDSPVFSTVAACLEDLGLNHIKQNYLAGVGLNISKDQKSESSRQYLREKWFEDALTRTSQWDDTLMPTDEGQALYHAQRLPTDTAPQTENKNAHYHESIFDSLQCFARSDIASGLIHLVQARRSVLTTIQQLSGSEAQTSGMVEPLSRLRTLSQLELVGRTLENIVGGGGDSSEGISSLEFLLKRWGFAGSVNGEELSLLDNDVNYDMSGQDCTIDGPLFRAIHSDFAVKEISLKLLSGKTSHCGVSDAITAHIFQSCRVYRELGRPDVAKTSLSNLRSVLRIFHKQDHTQERMQISSTTVPAILRLEDAKIKRCERDFDQAIIHCKMISSFLASGRDGRSDPERDHLRAESLLLGGLWMTQQNVEGATTVLPYYERASEMSMKIYRKSPTDAGEMRAAMASFKLGEFAASLYSSIDARMHDEVWKKRRGVALDRKNEMSTLKGQIEKARKDKNNERYAELSHVFGTMKVEDEMDEREVQSVQDSLGRFLHMAVRSYCQAIQLCPPSVAHVSKYVYEMISLWFKNCQKKKTMGIVNELIRMNTLQMPSYRLVPLTYQLFSRIDAAEGEELNGFQHTLRQLVLKLCSDHPYHGIVQLIALSNGQKIGTGVSGRHADTYLENVGVSKIEAVDSVIKELQKKAPKYVSGLIENYKTLCDSYISTGEWNTADIKGPSAYKNIPFSKAKLDLPTCLTGGGRRSKKSNASSDNMPVIITKPPSIRPDCQYGNGTEDPIGSERVVGFDDVFSLTPSGIHRPKIVICNGTKGGKFKQLVKAQDDMRQDAIMQQVFSTVNELLLNEGSTGNDFLKKTMGNAISGISSRRLRLITYGVVPLSPASGVLEWVDHTIAFGDFCDEKSRSRVGAHSRYYPGEWGNSDCRNCFISAQDKSTKEKLQTFELICRNRSPVFRFFFLEYFNSSMEAWHTARTMYTRSCAVNSIVGHVLGIGDRHTSNILVHTKTGEVVHIDFGIVFEQGKTLPTPERVPFRLTRDVIDGMGPSGTEGVFAKSAEATLSVLRNSGDTLLTILSAVVSDPLYRWSISAQKANHHQNRKSATTKGRVSTSRSATAETEESRNNEAERAITKIHAKLEGYEDGTSGEHKTIAGQVKLLINEASDPEKLSQMFVGWSPWT